MRRGPKRTAAQREQALLEVARLDGLGHTTRSIAAKMGVSHTQVEYDLRIIKRRYAEATLEERHAKVTEKIAQLRDVRRRAYEEWERSRKDRERTTKTKTGPATDAEGKPAGGSMKVTITTEHGLGRNEYLTTILRTLEDEADLLGLYAPVKVAPTTPDGDEQYGINPEELAALETMPYDELLVLHRRTLGYSDGERN